MERIAFMVDCLFNVANWLYCVTKCPEFSKKSSKCQLIGLASEGSDPHKIGNANLQLYFWIRGFSK